MRLRRLSVIASIAAMAVSWPSAARADGTVEIGFFAGWHFFNDDNELGQLDEADTDSLENGLTFGIRAARRFADLISAEGELALVPTTARQADVDVMQIGWRAHALVHPGLLALGPIQPFALLGAGGSTSSSADARLFGNDTDFVVHGGLGALYTVEDDWGIRLDARMLLPPSTASESVTHDWELLIALTKHFGGEKPPVVEDQAPVEPVAEPPAVEPTPVDSDGDGIADASDTCPDQPEDMDGDTDQDGCPDVVSDRDGDGIDDDTDRCPDEPETVNQYQDADGCPDEVPKEVSKFTGVIKGIQFQLGSANLTAGSKPVLDQAAKILRDHADLRVEISGHTDTTGSAERNRTLSQQRAEAVKAYLVDKGVDAGRLETVGHGPDKPIGSNDTKEGRTQNRRVEFRLL